MFKEINEGIKILDNESTYVFICNIQDKELKGNKNNSLINIVCKNKLEDIYIKKHKIGDIDNYNNVYYIFSLYYGGKSRTQDDNSKDSELMRFNYFKTNFLILLKEKNIKNFNLDYGNLIVDSNLNYDNYKLFFKEMCEKYDVNITIYIDKNYKILKPTIYEEKIDLSKLKFDYVVIDTNNIYKII